MFRSRESCLWYIPARQERQLTTHWRGMTRFALCLALPSLLFPCFFCLLIFVVIFHSRRIATPCAFDPTLHHTQIRKHPFPPFPFPPPATHLSTPLPPIPPTETTTDIMIIRTLARQTGVLPQNVQRRGLAASAVRLDKNFRKEEWSPMSYTTNLGNRNLVNSDTTLHEFMLYHYRLNRHAGSTDGRVGQFLETLQKNVGYVSLRSKAFNYSTYYYFAQMNQIASGLLFAYKLQPAIMNKVHHLLQYFHAGHTQENKAIMRKPVSYRYFWLWWMTGRSYNTPVYSYDKWVFLRSMAKGDVKLPKMRLTSEGMFRNLMNAFDSSGTTPS